MIDLLQRIGALLLAIIDREEELPPDIVEAARELEPDACDKLNQLLRERGNDN